MIIMPPQVFSVKKTFAATFFPEMPDLLRRQAADLRKIGTAGEICLNGVPACFNLAQKMKRPISLHRTLAATALAAFFLAGSLQAQEPAGMEKEPSGTEESGISTPRRVAGLGVLAFLIGWMVWRNGSRRHRDAGQDTETGNDDTGPKE